MGKEIFLKTSGNAEADKRAYRHAVDNAGDGDTLRLGEGFIMPKYEIPIKDRTEKLIKEICGSISKRKLSECLKQFS